ncbi:MAG: glycosyltransferase family 4 protein [Micavibrio sp.]
MRKIYFVIADMGAGGAQRVMSLIANRLAAEGDLKICVICTSPEKGPSFYAYDPKISITYIDVPSSDGSLLSGVLVNLKRVCSLRQYLKSQKPDLIISFLTEINCITLLATIGKDIPVVISERSDPYHYPEVRLWRILRRLVYPLSNLLVCQTNRASEFFHWLKHKAVIYNPVSINEGDEPAPYQAPYILGVGRHSEEKGFDILIEAHAIAQKRIPELTLVLLGDGPETQKLKELSSVLGTNNEIVFAGACTDVGRYYKHALAFILPSRFEGMPNALLEAMAYGCPSVVTSQFKAAPEIVDDGKSGVLLKSTDVVEMAEAICKIYEDEGYRECISINSRVAMQKFSPESVYKQWLDIIADKMIPL